MANKIQLRRDTAANWERVNPILDDGEPGLDITANQVKYGDGSTAWNDLPATGGGGFTDVLGVVTFPGDLLIGTLWPEDPMPGGDKESVIWAKDDTEYLGMWWGGDQTYPEDGYGPVAGIMIGAYDDMTDDFTGDPSPADTNITFGINDSTGFTNEWRFDRDGTTTFPTGGRIGATKGGTMLDGGNGFDTSLTTYYANTNYAACVTGFSSTGSLGITTYKDGGGNPSRTWTFDNDGNLELPPSGDILIDGGTNSAIRDILQNDVHTGAADYTLVLSDRGKMIYQTGGYSVIVPAADGSTLTFPVGTVITVVNSGGAGDLFIDAADAGANTDIYGAGTDTNSDTWALPSNSIASLMKVEASGAYSKWLLSGAGIYDNS
jgi:hypothetical protein